MFVLPSPKASSFVISTFTLSIAAFNSVFTVLISFLYPVAVAASLNPLSPCPGMTFPLRESWFLFSFSSFLSAVTLGILSTTKAFPFTADVAFATSSLVAASFAATAFALANSAFADSIAEAVFSVNAAFPKAASKRAIAASNLLVSAFITGASFGFGVSAGADGATVPVEARDLVESA